MAIINSKGIKTVRKELRNFGVTIGCALIFLGTILVLRRKNYYLYVFIVAVVFIGLGVGFPVALGPIRRYWMSVAAILGWITTRVILILAFFVILVPVAVTARLFGKKFLDLKMNKERRSYWIPRKSRQRRFGDYENQF